MELLYNFSRGSWYMPDAGTAGCLQLCAVSQYTTLFPYQDYLDIRHTDHLLNISTATAGYIFYTHKRE